MLGKCFLYSGVLIYIELSVQVSTLNRHNNLLIGRNDLGYFLIHQFCLLGQIFAQECQTAFQSGQVTVHHQNFDTLVDGIFQRCCGADGLGDDGIGALSNGSVDELCHFFGRNALGANPVALDTQFFTGSLETFLGNQPDGMAQQGRYVDKVQLIGSGGFTGGFRTGFGSVRLGSGSGGLRGSRSAAGSQGEQQGQGQQKCDYLFHLLFLQIFNFMYMGLLPCIRFRMQPASG